MLDEAAIGRFVREDYPRLVHALALVTGSVETAEDLVQEATARAIDQARRGRTIDSLPAWVTTVSLNLARSRWRRLAVERRARHVVVAASTEAAAPTEDRVEVEAAMAALPRRQREVAVLRYLIGMSTAETAATLGVSEGTVKNSLAKARTALAVALQIEEESDVADR